MEKNLFNGRISPSTSSAGAGSHHAASARSASPPLQPNYSSLAVQLGYKLVSFSLLFFQKALEHLASIDLIELCSESKVERCRATRDLRSCGRYVQHVLDSCGHASLCKECSQRCDSCPICRIPIPKNDSRLRPRLYCECIEAGLISKRCDERFQEKEDGDDQLTADVLRLYALFDVAMENNLVSLICHYDPAAEDMGKRIGLLLKLSSHLGEISNVLEVLDSSFKGSSSAQLNDLQFLHESVSKAKQAGSLFIEDALSNIEIPQGHPEHTEEELRLASLQKDRESLFRSKLEGLAICYPFESLQAAVDALFLTGSSDTVVAKEAIVSYMYYAHVNLVDRMIELPWNSDEEKYLRKSLLDCAIHDPSTTTGNLLVVYYLQRYRYTEAYEVDVKLQHVEQDFISMNSIDEGVLSRMRSTSHWRSALVEKSMQLLSPIQQQLVKDGILRICGSTPDEEIDPPGKSNATTEEHPTFSSSFVVPSNIKSSYIVLPSEYANPPFKSSLHHQTPATVGGSMTANRRFDNGNYGTPAGLKNHHQGSNISRNLKFDDVSNPMKGTSRSSNRHLHHYHQQDSYTEIETDGFDATSVKDPMDVVPMRTNAPFVPWINPTSPLTYSSGGKKASLIDKKIINGGPRWRSDETSDEEVGEESPGRAAAGFTVPWRGNRRVRVARR
ncbi:unnamed protein product [Linum tenue]|uniref:RING-type domain-containing protein n=1 Tax=Linum tenue TaxID=586396 RepID=A0AAV0JU52_9ROSI|nr:unnamed protein product [Linum tenue]